KPEIDFIFLASYGTGMISGGEVKVLRGVETELAGRDVVIVDDILDSGRTLAFAKTLFQQGGGAPACWSTSKCPALPRSSPTSRASAARRSSWWATAWTLRTVIASFPLSARSEIHDDAHPHRRPDRRDRSAGGDRAGAVQQREGPLARRAPGRRLSGDARHHQRHRADRLFQLTLSDQNGLIRRSR